MRWEIETGDMAVEVTAPTGETLHFASIYDATEFIEKCERKLASCEEPLEAQK